MRRYLLNIGHTTKHIKIERIAKKIKKELDIDCDVSTFRRTYAGSWQRSAGAWSWWMQMTNRPGSIGSSWSVSALLRKEVRLNLSCYLYDFDLEIYPKIVEATE